MTTTSDYESVKLHEIEMATNGATNRPTDRPRFDRFIKKQVVCVYLCVCVFVWVCDEFVVHDDCVKKTYLHYTMVDQAC